jgi:hypothetical protein
MVKLLKKALELLVTLACYAIAAPGFALKAIGYGLCASGMVFTGMASMVFTGLDCLVNFDCDPNKFSDY